MPAIVRDIASFVSVAAFIATFSICVNAL